MTDNIKIDLGEILCEDEDWIQLARYKAQWLAFVNMAMNVRGP
jgi:hypothetical protein